MCVCFGFLFVFLFVCVLCFLCVWSLGFFLCFLVVFSILGCIFTGFATYPASINIIVNIRMLINPKNAGRT